MGEVAIQPETVWATLRRQVNVGDEFATWSTTGRARGIPFKVLEFTNSTFAIVRLNDGKSYAVFPKSFEEMARIWPDYLAGRYPRHEMGKLTFASSYILGIFAKLQGLAK